MPISRLGLGLLLLLAAAFAFSDTGAVRVTSFPKAAVADGRSTLTISAEVRDNDGSAVPDGTQVVFQTTLGTFRESTVTTTGGIARATLITGALVGTARVTVTALRFNATGSVDVEFVGSAAEISRSRNYIEIVAPTAVMFSMDYGIVAAAAPGRGAKVQHQNFNVEADDLQLDVSLQDLKARNALVKLGGKSIVFKSLRYSLATKSGRGVTDYEADVPIGIRPSGRFIEFVTEKRMRTGVVEIASDGTLTPAQRGLSAGRMFDFEDLAGTMTSVSSRKMVLVPGKELHFHKATVSVEGQKAFSLPLFQVSLQGGNPTSLADQIFTFNDSRLGIDYAHYLGLDPGKTSLLRFRTGQRYGRTSTGSGGSFLDYEMKWNQGDAMEGGLVVSGIMRDDWTVDANQDYRYSDGSSLSALISSPAHRSIFGSVNYAKPIGTYQLSLNTTANKTLRGPDFESVHFGAVLESKGVKAGSFPATFYYGLAANDTNAKTATESESNRNVGMRLRGTFNQMKLSGKTTLDSSFTANQLWGDGNAGFSWQGNLSLRSTVGNSTNLSLGYEIYGGDALEFSLTGKQRLTFQGGYTHGNTQLSLMGSRSLDADWSSLFLDASYKLGGPFRFSGSYTLDDYLGSKYLDYDLTLWYQLGVRDIGLSWSKRTNRLGIQFLGARF